MRPRRYLIAASLTVHAAVVLALFVAGFWKIDRLDSPRHTVDLRAPNPPAPAPEGGPQVAQAEPFKKKDSQKKVIKELRQPDEIKETEDKPPTTTATDGGGSGSATGPGTGSGDPTSTGTCTENCGPSAPQEPEKKVIADDPCVLNPASCQITVAPPVIRGLRVAGETQIQPPDLEKTAIMRSGNSRAMATVKVCVGDSGNVVSLGMFKGSGYDGWDAKIIGAMRNWRYKPYKVGSRSVTVCGMVTFVYEIH